MSIPSVTFPPYDDGTPQPTDIPRDNQEEFINNFFTLNQQLRVDHIPPGNVVKTVTSDPPNSIFDVTQHYLQTGDNITLTNFKAINALGNLVEWSINGNSYNITKIDDDSFSIVEDTSAEPPYQENSGSYLVNKADFYGLHKKVTFATPIAPINPNVINEDQSFLYTQRKSDNIGTKMVDSFALFFQNAEEILRLTGQDFEIDTVVSDIIIGPSTVGTNTQKNMGFKSPFGLIFNFGSVSVDSNQVGAIVPYTVSLKIPYTTTHFSIIQSMTKLNRPNSATIIRVSSKTLTSFTANQTTIASAQPSAKFIAYYLSIGI